LTIDASELERRWRLAETKPVRDPDEVTADPLPLTWPESPVMAGVDGSGVRHLLLPIGQHIEVPSEMSGAVVTLRKRVLVRDGASRTYLDLACKRAEVFDQFAILSAELLATAAPNPDDVVEITMDVLSSWRELLRSLVRGGLGREGVIGLFGELLILKRMLAIDARHSVEAWTGPGGGRHDFQRALDSLEVKSSTARRGRPVVIHGLDQLERLPNTRLYLWWLRLEVSVGRGESLGSLVNHVLDACPNRADLEQKLAKAGYELNQPELYDQPLFTRMESRLYLVDDSFPALTRHSLVAGELPAGVIAVSYEINLSGDKPGSVESADEERLLNSLARPS
jgi:hypothetical protein